MLISLEEKAYSFSYIFCAILRPLRGQDHNKVFGVFFQRSTFFVGSAWSFGFFIPTTTANDL